jgi:hypothetical protein
MGKVIGMDTGMTITCVLVIKGRDHAIHIVDDQTYLCEFFQYELTGENCHITGVSKTESFHGFEGRGCCTISMERTPVFQS